MVEGLDIIILRELTGGVYFGEPKTITDLGNGQKRAIDTQVYDTYEIERIARVGFELARKRRNKVTSMEKRNVMKTGVLWREVVADVHAREYKDVELEHMLADAGGMQLVRWPKQFDVIVTDNLFGDMLSDIAAMLTGSLGMLPSASLGEVDAKTKRRKALYEPVHGSAPDIAGKGIANPIAMLASFGMALRYSFNMGKEADLHRRGDRRRAGQGLAHRRHQVGRRQGRQHHPKWARRLSASWKRSRPSSNSALDRRRDCMFGPRSVRRRVAGAKSGDQTRLRERRAADARGIRSEIPIRPARVAARREGVVIGPRVAHRDFVADVEVGAPRHDDDCRGAVRIMDDGARRLDHRAAR